MPLTLPYAPALLPDDEAAAYLSMSPRTLARERAAGKIIPKRTPAGLRYPRAELDRYAESLPDAERD